MTPTVEQQPLLTPSPKPSIGGTGLLIPVLLLLVAAQAIYIFHGPIGGHAVPVRAVISDANGNEPSRNVKPGKLLTLTSVKSGAVSSHWSVDPITVENKAKGDEINIVTPPDGRPFSVRLLVVKGETIDEAIYAFNSDGVNPAPPGPLPLPPGPGPSPTPNPVPPAPVITSQVGMAAQAYKAAMAAAFHKAGEDIKAGKATKDNFDRIIDTGVDGPSKALTAAILAAPDTTAAVHEVGDVIGGK